VHVRRNVFALVPDGPEISALRAGVKAMKELTASDPRSWTFQAGIHGSEFLPPDELAARTWNMCQHASFFFLSWHRMYIYFFERILRAASGEDDLALPYWNYSIPGQQALPVPFRVPAGASNPLFEARRNRGINQGALLPPSAVAISRTMAVRNFLPFRGGRVSFGGTPVPAPQHFAPRAFTGGLENQPHNIVHDLVGGPGLMGNPNTAAQDPIFWLHHSNIDRLWERWLDLGEGRANPVDNGVWMDTEFTFFDEAANEVEMSGREIVETALQLDYVYDDEPAGAAGALSAVGAAARTGAPEALAASASASASSGSAGEESEPTVIGSTRAQGGPEIIELGAEPTRVAVELAGPTDAVAAMAEAGTEGGPEAGGRIVLGLNGVQYDESPGVTYEVYLNLPEGQEPDYRSDYYVGNIGFFGMTPHDHEEHEGGHGHPANLSFDVTNNVRALSAKGEWVEGQADVSFYARGLGAPPSAQMSVADAEAESATPPEPSGSPRIEDVKLIVEPFE
jgi:hypothetical protein